MYSDTSKGDFLRQLPSKSPKGDHATLCIIMSWRFSLVGDSVIDGSVPGCHSMTSGLLVYMFSVKVLNLRTLNDYHSMITDCMWF